MPPSGKRPGKVEDSSAEFDRYFSQQFGVARWRALAKALQKETAHVALLNRFAGDHAALEGLKLSLAIGSIKCFRLPKSAPSSAGSQPELDPKTALRTHYWMDLASVYPVLLLGATPGMTVLDVAAAPGGKSLVLAHQMFASPSKTPPKVSASDTAPAPAPAPQQQEAHTGELQSHAPRQQEPDQLHYGQEQACPGAGCAQALEGVARQACTSSGGAQAEGGSSGAGPADETSGAAGASGSMHAQAGSCCATEQPEHAPGSGDAGKGGILGQLGSLHGQGTGVRGGTLVVNEPDATRRARLQRVLTEYLPHALVAGSAGASAGAGKRGCVGAVRVVGHEAEKYWSRHEFERYDRVLLDAPCSNDRHIVQQSCARRGLIPSRDWSLQHCRQLASLQLQLLVVGLRALAEGGRLVYSTCSLAQMENDGVVGKALERHPNVRVVMPDDQGYFPATLEDQRSSLLGTFGPEATKHGVLLMPDLCGHGPIYVCVLEKQLAVHSPVPAAQGQTS